MKAPNIQSNDSTALLDIAAPANEVLRAISSRARNAIRRAEREGCEVVERESSPETYRALYDLMADTVNAKGSMPLRSYEYYAQFWDEFCNRGQGRFFFVYEDGKPSVGAFVINYGAKATYKDGGSTQNRKQYGDSHLVQWAAIRRMQELGCTEYDFCGTPPAAQIKDKSHNLYGMGMFKTSFTKTVTDFVGCHDYVLVAGPARPLGQGSGTDLPPARNRPHRPAVLLTARHQRAPTTHTDERQRMPQPGGAATDEVTSVNPTKAGAGLEPGILSDAEFEAFSLKHPQNNFIQSADFVRFQRARGQVVELFGVRRDGELVAAGKLNYTTNRWGYKVCECAKGPLMDYTDTALVRDVVGLLKERAAYHKAAELRISPNLPYIARDEDGAEHPEITDNRPLVAELAAPGL